MSIGQRIKSRREELGMSQEDLAHRIGYKSKSSINKIELSTSQAMFNMILKEDINIEYIYYYLNYLRETHFYDELVSTGTQSNLNADKVKNIPIYLPTKSEQDMISTLFNTFDKKIKLEENDLNNLTMFKKSLLQQMFI